MKKRIVLLLALILSLGLLAACGKKEDVSTKEETNVESQVAEEKQETKEEKASEAKEENNLGQGFYTEETLPNYEAKADEVVITDDSVSFVDGLGTEKTIKKNPQRVVGLYPSHTILWYESGGEMVGRITTKTSESRMPEESKNIEFIGDTTTADKLSIEKIMSVNPELVILGLGSQADMIETFTELGVETIVIDNENLDDYLKWVKVIANINNKPEIYDEVLKTVLEPVKEILLKVPSDNHPKALMMQANDKGTLVAYLPGTTAGGIMDDLKGENIAVGLSDKEHDPTKGVDKVDLSFEILLENQPDIILLKHSKAEEDFDVIKMVKDTLASNAVWTSLDAVKADEIYSLPVDYFYYKATLKYPQAYEYMAKILYPEIFGQQEKNDKK